jgi:NAD(P)-dependent dehydrogenase (short-subunit alcohol dehydrogenase family)
MKLEGKVALITGGGTGIGKAAAQMVAEEGGISIVAGRRIGPLEETVAEITQAGGKAAACPADVSKVEDIERLKDFVQENYGRLDILVNNAGSSLFKSFLDTSVEDLDRIYQVDLRSVYLVSQYMVPLMRENGGGSIINISSILVILNFSGLFNNSLVGICNALCKKSIPFTVSKSEVIKQFKLFSEISYQ